MQTELIKSLVDAGFTEEEAKEMILEKGGNSTEDNSEKDWSEEKEQELEKSAKEANELLELYKTKRPKPKKDEPVDGKAQKSEIESDLLKSIESDEIQSKISLIVKSQVSEIENSYAEKFSEIQKSLESISGFGEELTSIKEKIELIGRQTPPQKSIVKAEDAILQKAISGGIKDESGAIHYSSRTHKDLICNELNSIIELNPNTDLAKSVETDLMNYVAGSGTLGETAKIVLKQKKNIIVA